VADALYKPLTGGFVRALSGIVEVEYAVAVRAGDYLIGASDQLQVSLWRDIHVTAQACLVFDLHKPEPPASLFNGLVSF
jgi:hypothetical protein